MADCVQSFFVRYRFFASENGLYELANTFRHVAPGDFSSPAQPITYNI